VAAHCYCRICEQEGWEAMSYEEIVKVLAPCGLNCAKCLGYVEGDIKKNADELKRLLGAFDNYAERFSRFIPVFENYPAFKKLLDHFAQAGCKGCRNGDCMYPNCGVASCYKTKDVDFCFQCDEFPCERTNFDPNLKERWIKMNKLMKEKGVEAYYEESKDLPRYI
jgi:hypothetical protein